jgi:predicted TIM-barrel fold metal-dependent hydrolase
MNGLDSVNPSQYGRIVDSHVHIHPASAPDLLDLMEANGIRSVVNLGILEALGIPFSEGMSAFRAALGDRLVYFPTPSFADTSPGFGHRTAEEFERKVEAGAAGLKIFKELGLRHTDADSRLIPVDDPRLDPLWAKAGELGVPVLIHTADPVAFFQPLDEHNERWEELQRHPDWHFGAGEFPDHDSLLAGRNRVLERHPGTIFLGAHLGNYPEDLNYVDACLDRYPNLHVDTSARIGEIGRHPARKVRDFFLKHQDRIIFGSDLIHGWDAFQPPGRDERSALSRFYQAHWPFFETEEAAIEYPHFPLQGAWKVDAIGLPDTILEKLYFRNALRLIPGLGA